MDALETKINKALLEAMAEALNAIEGLEAKDRGQTAAIRYATRVLKDAIGAAQPK